jgi:hypothetical protein
MSKQVNDFTWPVILSLFLGGSTFLFTIFRFFWDQIRKSNLIVYIPHQYVFAHLRLHIAFTFKVDGPKSILVQDLQLVPSNEQTPLKFRYFVDELGKLQHKSKASFTINAGEQYTRFCEFQIPDSIPDINTEMLELQVLLGNSKKWKRNLCHFSLVDCEKIELPVSTISYIPDPFA